MRWNELISLNRPPYLAFSAAMVAVRDHTLRRRGVITNGSQRQVDLLNEWGFKFLKWRFKTGLWGFKNYSTCIMTVWGASDRNCPHTLSLRTQIGDCMGASTDIHLIDAAVYYYLKNKHHNSQLLTLLPQVQTYSKFMGQTHILHLISFS